jgi:hypothetical protein
VVPLHIAAFMQAAHDPSTSDEDARTMSPSSFTPTSSWGAGVEEEHGLVQLDDGPGPDTIEIRNAYSGKMSYLLFVEPKSTELSYK